VSPKLLAPREVAAVLSCGKTYVYELIGRGELPAVKLGRLTRVPLAAVEELVSRRLRDAGFDAQSNGAYTRSAVSEPVVLRPAGD